MKKVDLSGHEYGRLTVIKEGEKTASGIIRWICRCDCGNQTLVIGSQLKNGKTKSCGCLKKRPQREDLTGQKFGKLKVLRFDPKSKPKIPKWVCKCDCGSEKEISVFAGNLKKGHTTGCGCTRGIHKKIDLTGEKFNMLTVIRQDGYNKSGQANWLCECECGDLTTIDGYRLRHNRVKSCGCLNGGKHGLRKHPAYETWKNMNARCTRTDFNNRTYLERGIKVCEEWRDNPKEFIKWAEKNGFEKGLQLDRIDGYGNYEPSNCRFVSARVNVLNKYGIECTNKTGYIGVYKRSDHFVARVTHYKKVINLGKFKTAREAAEARDKYIIDNFPNDGYQLNFRIRNL